VEGDQVVRGVGVEHRPHALGGLVDLAVVVELLAALEDEVLEEVGHAVLLRALRARAGFERHEDRQGARPRDRHAVDGEPVGEGGGVDRGHVQRLRRRRRAQVTSPKASATKELLAWQAKVILAWQAKP
jgi:hypothetical protein